MTNTTQEGATMSLEKGLAAFVDSLLGKNRSRATLRAYRTDVLQFITLNLLQKSYHTPIRTIEVFHQSFFTTLIS